MLKSTIITPVLSPFPPKTKLITKLYNTIISNSLTPTVRQNASLETPQSTTYPPAMSAYIHLPFCRKRCHYCDFTILALGSSSVPDQDPRVHDYIALVRHEILATRLDFQNPPLKTVFFGGGTPSLVPPALVATVVDALREKFGVCLDAEISIEMDPGTDALGTTILRGNRLFTIDFNKGPMPGNTIFRGNRLFTIDFNKSHPYRNHGSAIATTARTFDKEKIKAFMDLGVNRVSLGVQAFQEELLNACGRAHGVKEVYEAIEVVKSCGVGNWSMDLISSLPHQTGEMWEESLRLAVEAQPTHVSVYDLQVEQGTKFGILYTPGESPLPSETQAANFYRMASDTLTKAGYEHYEVSSYCRSGFQCKHNVTYWNNVPFYGFGLGSASYLGGKRFSRPKKLKDYATYVQNLEDKSVNNDENSCVDVKDNAMDTVMLSLRTAKGMELKIFREVFGSSAVQSLCQAYKPYVESGHVVFLDENRMAITMDELCSMLDDEGGREEVAAFIRLGDPDGFLLSNELISIAFRIITP